MEAVVSPRDMFWDQISQKILQMISLRVLLLVAQVIVFQIQTLFCLFPS